MVPKLRAVRRPPTLLRRCLRKEARDRLHDIADARLELHDALTEPSSETPTSSSVTAALPRSSPLPWALAALLAVICVDVGCLG